MRQRSRMAKKGKARHNRGMKGLKNQNPNRLRNLLRRQNLTRAVTACPQLRKISPARFELATFGFGCRQSPVSEIEDIVLKNRLFSCFRRAFMPFWNLQILRTFTLFYYPFSDKFS